MSVAATGTPQDIASIAANPKGSSHVGVNSMADAAPISRASLSPARWPPYCASISRSGRTSLSK